MVNTLADVRGMLAAVERINTIVAAKEVDESLARGLAKESDEIVQGLEDHSKVTDKTDRSTWNSQAKQRSLDPKSTRSVCELAWSGDVVLDGMHFSATGKQVAGERERCSADEIAWLTCLRRTFCIPPAT